MNANDLMTSGSRQFRFVGERVNLAAQQPNVTFGWRVTPSSSSNSGGVKEVSGLHHSQASQPGVVASHSSSSSNPEDMEKNSTTVKRLAFRCEREFESELQAQYRAHAMFGAS